MPDRSPPDRPPPDRRAPRRRAPYAPARGAARVLLALAGLASAGLVVIGIALVLLQLLARDIAPGTGLVAAVGPTWPRALSQLGVGVVGEVLVRLRPRVPLSVRVYSAAAVLCATGVVLWLCWWR